MSVEASIDHIKEKSGRIVAVCGGKMKLDFAQRRIGQCSADIQARSSSELIRQRNVEGKSVKIGGRQQDFALSLKNL